jgi:outer membrane protein OmpA-like peptidoglycan-associated protein
MNFSKTSSRVGSMSQGVALQYNHPIRNKYNWSVMASGFFSDTINDQLKFKRKYLQIETAFMANRSLTPAQSFVQPYLGLGVGINFINKKLGTFIPFGAGMQIRLTKDTYAVGQVQYRRGVFSPIPSHYLYGLGLSASLNKGKSENKKSKLHSVPIIYSSKDTLASSYSDTDHDGLIDTEDACPNEPGTKSNNGCPSIQNKTSEEYVTPAVVLSNRNQQLILDTSVNFLNRMAKNILFKSNSHVIKKESHLSLDQISVFLSEHPNFAVIIEGHTDDIGSAEDNLILSRRRAESVYQYLLSKGIASSRMQTVGYGETQPLNTKKNDEARATNRRVQFQLSSGN